MNAQRNTTGRSPVNKTIRLLAAIGMVLLTAQQSMASTAANTSITNTVTVTFDNTAGVAQTAVTASTTVTVTLVAAAPTLNSPGSIDPSAENTLNPLTYTISSNANGPDTYALSAVSVDDANLSVPALVNNAPANPIPLGGTTLNAAVAVNDTVITVPYDGTSDGIVNGIAADDWIVIGGDPDAYQVLNIVEDPVGNTSTLTLYAATPIANVAAVGTIVGEQVTFTLDVTTGILSSGGSGTHSISMTATSTADNTLSTTQGTATVITVRRPQLSVSKYVRNATDTTVTGTGVPVTVGSFDYYPTGITGEPGDVLAYLIVVSNPAGSGQATDVIIRDPIPLYTSYVTGTMQLDPGTGTFTAVTDGEADNDAGEYNSTAGSEEVWIYAGTGGLCGNAANGFGDGTGGTLDADITTRGIFHVRIQP